MWNSSKNDLEDLLAVQQLRLSTFNTGGMGSIPGQGTRPHMLHSVANFFILFIKTIILLRSI